jgi:hypothetical protein
MSDQRRRTPTELLQAAGGFLAALAALSAKLADYFGFLGPLLPQSLQISSSAQTAVATMVVLLGLFFVWNGLRVRSRLLRPDALLIVPDRPEHLEGRAEDIERVTKVCRQNRMVCLIGESGAGKTALLRAGLVPRISDSFHPVYVDTWGDDWERGPRRSLREAFARSLTPQQGHALGAGKPLDDDRLFDVLRRCSSAIGRRPLIILDQFDDYQILHLNRFLIDQVWIDVETLVSQNAFWADLHRLLDAEDAHLLVSTRSDAADGLDSIRIVAQPTRYHLPRLGEAVVEPLLIRLTKGRDDEPPIVANPDSGWTQLRARLASELANNGGVLAAQMRVAFASLANLNPLSIASFEAIGGLKGLEAAYIRRHVAETARVSGLTEPQTRRALLGLVDPAGTKTSPRSGADLRALLAASLSPLATTDLDGRLQRALEDLIGKQIVRRLPAAPAGDAEYVLMHDYLCGGVLEAERQANRWTAVLKERHDAFASPAGSAWRTWKSLLAPALSMRLALHRIRGEFRYGPYRRYAAWSLARFLPALAAIGVAAAIGYRAAKFQSEVRSQFEEADVRERASRMFDPIGVGGPDEPLSDRENEALWRLVTTGYAERRAFLRKVLESSDNARRFMRRSQAVLHALWGLDRDLATRLCEEACWPAGGRDTDPEILQAQAVIGAALPSPNLLLLESVLSNTPVMIRNVRNATDPGPVAKPIAAFASRSDPEYARRAFDRLVIRLENEYFDDIQYGVFGTVLGALADRLGPGDVPAAFLRTQRVMQTTRGLKRWPAFAETLIRLAARLGPAEAQSVFSLIVSTDLSLFSYSFQSKPMLPPLYAHLGLVVPKLSDEDVRGDLERVLSVVPLSSPSESYLNRKPAYHALFGAFGRRLDPATADMAFGRCWDGAVGTNYQSRPAHEECVQMLAPALGPRTAKEYLTRLASPKWRSSFIWTGETTVAVTTELARRLDPADAAALFVPVRSTMRSPTFSQYTYAPLLAALARRIAAPDISGLFQPPVVTAGARNSSSGVLAAILADLQPLDKPDQKTYLRPAYGVLIERAAAAVAPGDADTLFSELSAPFRSREYFGDMLVPHARAVAALAPKLASDSVVPAVDILTRMLRESTDNEAWQTFGAALEVLGPRLDQASARAQFRPLYETAVGRYRSVGSGSSSSEPAETQTRRRAAYALALSGMVRPGDEQLLVDLLKRPDEISRSKEALAPAFRKLLGDPSLGEDVWRIAEAAEKRKLDVTAPPSRW